MGEGSFFVCLFVGFFYFKTSLPLNFFFLLAPVYPYKKGCRSVCVSEQELKSWHLTLAFLLSVLPSLHPHQWKNFHLLNVNRIRISDPQYSFRFSCNIPLGWRSSHDCYLWGHNLIFICKMKCCACLHTCWFIYKCLHCIHLFGNTFMPLKWIIWTITNIFFK